jgi:hypothetical protein
VPAVVPVDRDLLRDPRRGDVFEVRELGSISYPGVRDVAADVLASMMAARKLYVLRMRWPGLPPLMSTSAVERTRRAPWTFRYQ